MPIAIPAWIFSALKPGGIAGSEKSSFRPLADEQYACHLIFLHVGSA